MLVEASPGGAPPSFEEAFSELHAPRESAPRESAPRESASAVFAGQSESFIVPYLPESVQVLQSASWSPHTMSVALAIELLGRSFE
jgi:hypothetical protein